MTEGEVTASVQGNSIVLQKGDGIFINSGVLHSYAGTSGQKSEMPNLLFSPLLISETAQSVIYRKYISRLIRSTGCPCLQFTPDSLQCRQSLLTVRTAYESFLAQDFGYEWAVKNALSELLFSVCHRAFQEEEEPESPPSADIARLRLMVQFIQEHFAEPLTVSCIAAAAGISVRECLRCGFESQSYFTKSFRKKTGETLTHFRRFS